ATLASPAIPLPRENRAQSGVAGDTTKPARVEGEGGVLHPPTPQGGEPQPSLHPEGGGPVLTDREREENGEEEYSEHPCRDCGAPTLGDRYRCQRCNDAFVRKEVRKLADAEKQTKHAQQGAT